MINITIFIFARFSASVFAVFTQSRVHLCCKTKAKPFGIFYFRFASPFRPTHHCAHWQPKCAANWIVAKICCSWSEPQTAAVQRQCNGRGKGKGNLMTLFRHLPASQCRHFCHFCISNDRQLSFVDTPLCLFSFFSPLRSRKAKLIFRPSEFSPVYSIVYAYIHCVIVVHLRVSFSACVLCNRAGWQNSKWFFQSTHRMKSISTLWTGQTIICRVIKATFVATLCILFAFRWPHDKFYVEISWDWSARI